VGGAFSASCGCEVETSTDEDGDEEREEKVGEVCGGVCEESSGEPESALSAGNGYSNLVECMSENGVPMIIEDGE
jgi:hypothetical protein